MKAVINDPINAYFGREGTVRESVFFGDIEICQVMVGNICTSVRRTNLKEVENA